MRHEISIGGSTIKASDELMAAQGCVYKLFYNDYYIIQVGETFAKSINVVHTALFYTAKGTKSAEKEGTMFFKLTEAVKNAPHGQYAIEILLVSDKPYQLLKQGQMALFGAKNDPFCLNRSFDVYVGKYIQHPKSHQKWKWWANRGHYLNFLRWKKAELLRQSSLDAA
jgi:hypothetical protein